MPSINANLNGSSVTSGIVNGWSTSSTTISSNTSSSIVYKVGDHSYSIEDTIQFYNFIMEIMGVDLDYNDFCKMSKEERKSFIRDIKINKIL